MTLKYTETIHQPSVEHEREITIPDYWSMFTSTGNKRISQLAEKFLKAVDSGDSYITKIQAALDFLLAYRKLDRFKSYSEAGDTAVRIYVWDFFAKVCNAVDIDADSLWDQRESYPK